jgi:NAD(P)-dependent dehydrogenase (short-subunit alcohol dehydrogenase family)
MQLAHRVALITGAGRGIGRAIALAYAKEGARVALAARTVSELQETARLTEALGAPTCVIGTDVADPAQVEAMVRQTLERFSTLHILVNNAAMLGPVEPLWETDIAAWMQTIQVNLMGTYLCCRAVLPVMLAQRYGKIINVTSGARVRGSAAFIRRHQTAYYASKAAITQLTELLASQVCHQPIQVNAMSPGGRTRMTEGLVAQAQALGDSDLVASTQQVIAADPRERSAALAVFLASDASGTLSGRVLSHADDFDTLASRIEGIMASDAYTLRRVEEK